MRTVLLAVAAAIALVGQLGLALSSPSPHLPAPARTKPVPASIAAGKVRTGEAAFPNCPAPAVNGINVRAVKTTGGSQLTIFVVVQNVGNRTFLPQSDKARLTVTMGGAPLGSFPVGRLGASEVKFFSVETAIAGDAAPGDILAGLDFGPQATIGPVADTQDCQVSDNAVTRKSQSIRFASIHD